MHSNLLKFAIVAWFALSMTISHQASAESLALPTGDVLLSVSGDIAVTNTDGAAVFDLEMLIGLDVSSFSTTTIWTEGTQTFTGVPLKSLVEALGVSSGTLLATAINDYTVEIPLEDAVEGGPIIAYALNNEPMSIRDKGPLWVVYPYDQSADYRSEVVYSRSIWQLDRIEVVQ